MSLIDQLVDRILLQQVQAALTDNWPRLPVQVGIGFTDEQIAEYINQFHKDWFINSDDTKKWDFSVLEQDLFLCAILTFRSFDKSLLSEKEVAKLYNVILNRAKCLSRKVGVLSDGSIFDQMDHTHAGIMPSGAFVTAFWNSIIRCEIARIVYSRLNLLLLMVKAMGDDCNTASNQYVESELLAKEYLKLGKIMHFSQVSRPGEPFEFCSQMYDRATGKGVPTSWPRMLFRMLGKEPTPELLCSFDFETRNLDPALKQKISTFLFEVGWCLKDIAQAAMPKKAAAKQAKKSIKKQVKKEVRKDVVSVSRELRGPSARRYPINSYARQLQDPFVFGAGGKIPDLQTGRSATVRSFTYLSLVTQGVTGCAAICFDPVNIGGWYQTAAITLTSGAINSWSSASQVPNFGSMTSVASYRLTSAGFMFVPNQSLTTSQGQIYLASNPATASTTSYPNVTNIQSVPGAITFPIARSYEAYWTPRDFGSFSYYPFPAAGVKSTTGVENNIMIGLAGAPLTSGISVGAIALVANYEVVITNDAASILSSSESPSDFPQMEYAANTMSDARFTRDLGFEGGVGDAFSSGMQSKMYDHLNSNSGNWDGSLWKSFRRMTKGNHRNFQDEN